jgi:hypothetical protein
MTGYCPAGLPHSEIPGSKPACGSPRLIAAYRVLRRLSAPRHPPCTLSSLTNLEFATLNPANPIASNPIQLSRNLIWDRWDPRFLRVATKKPSISGCPPSDFRSLLPSLSFQQRTLEAHSRRRRFGGADRARTDDLRLARAALSQLSYSPVERWPERPAMVGLGRLELPTSRLSGVRSNQLSYRPRQGVPIPWKPDRG